MPAIRRILSEENSIFQVLGRAKPPVQWFSLPFASHLNAEKKHDPAEVPKFISHAVSLGGEYPDYISKKLRTPLPPEEAEIAFPFEYPENHLSVPPTLPARNPHS